MSKRDEGASIESYIQTGFLPDAVFNYLCLLGWTPKLEEEILSSSQATQSFDISEVHHSNARFDMVKCRWLNQHYLRALDPNTLDNFIRNVDEKVNDPSLRIPNLLTTSPDFSSAVFQSVKEKISITTEFPQWVHFFFTDDFPIEEDVMSKLTANELSKSLLSALHFGLKSASIWDEMNITSIVSNIAIEHQVKVGAIMPLMRFSLSGQTRGPDVKVMMGILGQANTLTRIQRLITLLP